MVEERANQPIGPWQALELFAGIGGFAAAWPDVEVVRAIDIDQRAAATYRHNFSHPYDIAEIATLNDERLLAFSANLWWLSPPCQPFSRRGQRRDHRDSRSQALWRLIDAIDICRPRVIALENVIGFAESVTYDRLVTRLNRLGYVFQQRELCPSQLGWPNRRPRFYLLAMRGASSTHANSPSQTSSSHSKNSVRPLTDIRLIPWRPLPSYQLPLNELLPEIQTTSSKFSTPPWARLVGSAASPSADASQQPGTPSTEPTAARNERPAFLRTLDDGMHSADRLWLSQEEALRFMEAIDRIPAEDPAALHTSVTACFASSYGKAITRSGSYLQYGAAFRRFTPDEVARLLGYPPEFRIDLPSRRSAWKLLGNSLSLPAVRYILSHIPHGPESQCGS